MIGGSEAAIVFARKRAALRGERGCIGVSGAEVVDVLNCIGLGFERSVYACRRFWTEGCAEGGFDKDAACGRVPAERRLPEDVNPVRAEVGDVCRGVTEPTLRAGGWGRCGDVVLAEEGKVDSSLSRKSSMPPIAVGGG